jgi:hypothetical protein
MVRQSLQKTTLFVRSYKRVLITFLVVALLVVADAIGHTSLFAEATSAQPQSFTELYFAQPNALPKYIRTSTKYDVPFVISNHNTTAARYTYIVTVQTDAAIVRQKPVTIAVAQGTASVIHASVTSPVPNEQVLVTIALEHTNQFIQFYAQP